jgi:hypothetical protein
LIAPFIAAGGDDRDSVLLLRALLWIGIVLLLLLVRIPVDSA